MFLNNRYHDPTLGTFISVDPLVASTGEPYIYASGNPTTHSDPTGLCTYVSGTCYFGGGVQVDVGGNGGSRGGGGNGGSSSGGSKPPSVSIPYPLPTGGSSTGHDVYDRVATSFGFNALILRLLDDKETQGLLEEWAKEDPVLSWLVDSWGPLNISQAVADDVWAVHSVEILAYFAENGDPFAGAKDDFMVQYWPTAAEDREISLVFATLHLQDLSSEWDGILSAQSPTVPVTAN